MHVCNWRSDVELFIALFYNIQAFSLPYSLGASTRFVQPTLDNPTNSLAIHRVVVKFHVITAIFIKVTLKACLKSRGNSDTNYALQTVGGVPPLHPPDKYLQFQQMYSN